MCTWKGRTWDWKSFYKTDFSFFLCNLIGVFFIYLIGKKWNSLGILNIRMPVIFFRKLNYIVARCFEPSVIFFISSHFAVVLQGSLHLEVQPGAARAWWELGLLVKIWVMFQDVWRWSSFPQQAVQWPPVSTEAVMRLIQNSHDLLDEHIIFVHQRNCVIILKL